MEKERTMKKKGGGSKEIKSAQMEGLWEELAGVFGDPPGGVKVDFECVPKSTIQPETRFAQRCEFRNTCIGRILLRQHTGNACSGPDFCEILAKLSEEAVSD